MHRIHARARAVVDVCDVGGVGARTVALADARRALGMRSALAARERRRVAHRRRVLTVRRGEALDAAAGRPIAARRHRVVRQALHVVTRVHAGAAARHRADRRFVAARRRIHAEHIGASQLRHVAVGDATVGVVTGVMRLVAGAVRRLVAVAVDVTIDVRDVIDRAVQRRDRGDDEDEGQERTDDRRRHSETVVHR